MWTDVLARFGFTQFVAIRLVASLVLTIAVELPVAMAMGLRSHRDISTVVWMNVLTNPVVVWSLLVLAVAMTNYGFIGNDEQYWAQFIFWLGVLALEALAVAVEAVVLRWVTKRPWQRCLSVSLAMNAASLTVGFFFWTLLATVVSFVTHATWPQA